MEHFKKQNKDYSLFRASVYCLHILSLAKDIIVLICSQFIFSFFVQSTCSSLNWDIHSGFLNAKHVSSLIYILICGRISVLFGIDDDQQLQKPLISGNDKTVKTFIYRQSDTILS